MVSVWFVGLEKVLRGKNKIKQKFKIKFRGINYQCLFFVVKIKI